MLSARPTAAIIDTAALKYNYRQLRSNATQATKIMAIVKANAYGHGDLEAAKVFESLGCEFFGVAIAEEGAKLRVGGIISPIVILGGIYPGQVKDIFDLDLTPVVFDLNTARLINEYAKKINAVKKVHIKIDTGMGRIGLLPHQVVPFFQEFRSLTNLQAEAVLSHFVESESEDREYSKKQVELFLQVVEAIKNLGFAPEFIDMANSAAAVDFEAAHFNIIRPGIMLYGSYPAQHLRDKIKLKPVMSLKTEIMHIKNVPAGFSISYGRTFVTTKESVIATLPIGYADGIPRRLSGKGEVLVRGMRAPMVGRVCMDLMMCDVTDIKDASIGDEVVIIGAQGKEEITAEEIAAKTDTISYEIFCNISARVPRIYK